VSVAAVVAIISLWIGLSQAVAARDEADETATDAMNMVDQLMVTISEDRLLNQPGMQKVRADIMAQAEDQYAVLLKKLERNQRLPERIAMVRFKIGGIKHYLNAPVEALSLYESASESLQSLYERDPKSVRLLRDLSDVKIAMARLHYEQKRYSDAEAPMREALDLRQKLADAQPDDNESAQLLANSEMNMGLLEEELGHPRQALALYEAAQRRRKEILVKDKSNIGVKRDHAKGLSELGMFHARQQKLKEAAVFFEQAEQAFVELTDRKDRQLDDLLNHGIVLRRLGDMAAVRNDEKSLQNAIDRYVKSVKLLEELVTANSSVGIYRGTLAATKLNLAQLYQRQKNAREAFALLTSAFDDFNKLKAEDASYKKHEKKSFYEMLRLKKWNKLGTEQQTDLVAWIEFATTQNGETWVQSVEKQASTAPEFPQALRLEETDLFMPAREEKPGR